MARLVQCRARCRSHLGSRSVVGRLCQFSAILLLHADDQGSYFGHIRVHGRVVSGRRVAAGASRAGFGTVGGDTKRLDRLRVLEYYVAAYVFVHTLNGCLDGEPLIWNVQTSHKACLHFDKVGRFLVGALLSFPQFRHECSSMGVVAGAESLLETLMCSSSDRLSGIVLIHCRAVSDMRVRNTTMASYSDVHTEVGDPVVCVEVAVGAEMRRQKVDVAGEYVDDWYGVAGLCPGGGCVARRCRKSVVTLLPVRRRRSSVRQ